MGGQLRIGEVLAGRYRVERVLGVGGAGVVLGAQHVDLEAPRAVKIPWPHETDHPAASARFLREARITTRYAGEHVVRVHDAGRLESGAPYIVMERLEGLDLDELLRRSGRLAPGDAARYVVQVCGAMEAIHASGVVHLDLKPANLFLTEGGDGSACVKVLDFGVARSVHTAGSGTTVEGTPTYMAPEQTLSGPQVTCATDVWALGVTLYELLTGCAPFRGRTVDETFQLVLHGEPEPLAALRPELPRELAGIVERCLQKSPARRFPNAGELGAALAPFAPAGRAIPRAVALAVAASEEDAGPRAEVTTQRLSEDAEPARPTMGSGVIDCGGDAATMDPHGGTSARRAS